MKDKELRIRMDSDFESKVEYLKEINGYKNKSDTIRKTVEKEYRKETFEGIPNNIILRKMGHNIYVRIVDIYDYANYTTYLLDMYDDSGNPLSIKVPKIRERDYSKSGEYVDK